MDKFEEFQAFVTVVDAGSFTAAAERLDAAKSAVSRRVSGLEERLGVQLLRRTTRVLNLTEAGRGFYEHGKRILADLEEAEAGVQQQHGELRGTLRVALPLSFGVRHMSKPIAAFNKLHPKVEFDLDLNDRRVDLINDNFDLALRIGHLQDSSLIARRLFESRSIIAASPHYLGVHGEPTTPDDLQEHRCLVYSNLADPNKWVYRDSQGKQRDLKVKSAMRASSGDYLCNAAALGAGLVMQPMFIASQAIRSGSLVPILTAYDWPTSPAYVVYPPTRHLSFRVRAFIDFLVERFSGEPEWERDCKQRR
jgi:DNA-binding transcriptional LysR family regulator